MSDSQFPAGPPPHPYAAAQPGGPSARPPKKGLLGVFSMLAGLIGLLTAIVAAFYAPGFGPVSGVALVLGLAGIALGAVALGLRQRPLAAGIVGIGTGAIAIILSILLILMGAVTAFGGAIADEGDGSGEQSMSGEGIADWPANMSTGGVVFAAGLQPVESAALEDGEEPAVREIDAAGDGADMQIYVDYRCPSCSAFEETNGETLEEVVSSGAATLEVRALTFLDRVSPDAYSSRAAGAVACVVDQQPENAWAAHTRLLDPAVQPPETEPGLSNEQIADHLDEATGGLTEQTRSCIETEHFAQFSHSLYEWLSLNPVPRAEDPALMATGTPFVVVDGVQYEGSVSDASEFRAFLEARGVELSAAQG